MAGSVKFAPATPRRAFFVLAAICAAAIAFAAPPPASQAPLAQVGKPSTAESATILEQFRRSGWFGYVEFDLRALPRRGDEVIYHGRLWGAMNDQGAITRIEITDAKGGTQRFLLQNGDRAAVWRVIDGKVAQVDGTALFNPLIPGVEVTAFDLQMPYLYWPGYQVESVERIRGRPAYAFLFRPPASFAAKNPKLQAVRAYFDAQYGAPVQTELLDSSRVIKTTSLVDLKKVGEQWIPKSFDIRNEVSRDKTRFQVTAVALNLTFPNAVFAPAALADEVRPPAADRIVRIDQ